MQTYLLCLQLLQEFGGLARYYRGNDPRARIGGRETDLTLQLGLEKLVEVFRHSIALHRVSIVRQANVRLTVGRPIDQASISLLLGLVRVSRQMRRVVGLQQ